MASETLPVFTHPNFPQVFPSLFAQEVLRVERVLGSCCHEETYGTGENISGWSCQQQALVSDLNTGLALCEFHWEASRA